VQAEELTRIALQYLHIEAAEGDPLPNRAQWEQWSGTDLSDTRLKTGLSPEIAARAVGAEAFAIGSTIAVAEPTAELLAHELAHVAGRSTEALASNDFVEGQAKEGSPIAVLSPGAASEESGGVLRRAELGIVPEGATPNEEGLIWTTAHARTPREMLRELRSFMVAALQEARAANEIDDTELQSLQRTVFFLVLSDRARLYDLEGNEIGTYPMQEEPSIPSGYYVDSGGEFMAEAVVNGERAWLPVQFNATEGEARSETGVVPASPFTPRTDDFSSTGLEVSSGNFTQTTTGLELWLSGGGSALIAALASRNATHLFLAIPPRTGTGDGRRFHWGERQRDEVNAALARALREEDAAAEEGSTEEEPTEIEAREGGEESTTAEHGVEGGIEGGIEGGTVGGTGDRLPPTPPPPARDRPDRVVYWTNEDAPYLNVWVDGAVEAIRLRPDESTEQTVARVREAAERLRDSRDPANSVRIENGIEETGFEGGSTVPIAPEVRDPFGRGRGANAPAYPARLINHGQDITVIGASNQFTMELDYSPAGVFLIDQVTARMQHISFYWELIDVSYVRDPDPAEISARNRAGTGSRVDRGDAILNELGHDLEDYGEDNFNDVDAVFSGHPAEVVATWPVRSAYLSVVGISNIVRLGGSLISAFFRLVTEPRNERGIPWAHAGDYLIRCVATPQAGPDAQVIRAPSVAVSVVRVQDIETRATEENDRTLEELRMLRAELRDLPAGEQRTNIEARIAALERADQATVGTSTEDSLAATRQSLETARALQAANAAHLPREARTSAVRVLYVELELMGISLDDYIRQLETQERQLTQLKRRNARYDDLFGAQEYRPQVTFASERNGMVTRMLMRLGQHPSSTEAAKHWVLADVTTGTPTVHHGRSSTEGVAGHAAAIRSAFVDFRENAEYGRGTIAIRLPDAIGTDLGGEISIDPAMRAAPGLEMRVIARLTDLATAAEIAGLLIAGPIGIAIGVAGGVAGAVVSAHNMIRRAENRTFEWDFQAIMDVAGIVGGVFGVVGAGSAALRSGPRWVRRVERLQHALHIYGYVQSGAQVIIIPLQLQMELEQIENDPTLSPGEKSARRAEAILRAVRGGVITVMSAAQMVDSGGGTRSRDVDVAPDPHAAVPADGVDTVPGDAGPVPSDSTVLPGRGDEGPPIRLGDEETPPPVREEEPSRAAGGDTETTTRARAGNPRMDELNAALGDLSGQVRIIDDPDTRPGSRTARVRFVGDELVMLVGDGVTPRQIRDHLSIARVLARYRGPIGALRRLIDRVLSALRIRPDHTTRGGEARLEVQKLNEILTSLETLRARIDERARTLGSDAESSARVREVDQEIAELEAQLAENERLINSYEDGRGFVAAYETASEGRIIEAVETLRAEYPSRTFERAGDRIRLPGGREIDPPSVRELLDNRTVAPPASDMTVLIEASLALEATGERAGLAPHHQRALDRADAYARLRIAEAETAAIAREPGARDSMEGDRAAQERLLEEVTAEAATAAGGVPTSGQILDALASRLGSDEARAGLAERRRAGDDRALDSVRSTIDRGNDLDYALEIGGTPRPERVARRARYEAARVRETVVRLEAMGVLDDPDVRAAIERAATDRDSETISALSGPIGEALMRAMLLRRFGDPSTHRIMSVVFAEPVAGTTRAEALANAQAAVNARTPAGETPKVVEGGRIFENNGAYYHERGENDASVMARDGARLRPVYLGEAKVGAPLVATNDQLAANRGNYVAVREGRMRAFEKGAARSTDVDITAQLDLANIETVELGAYGASDDFPEATRLPIARRDLHDAMTDLRDRERARRAAVPPPMVVDPPAGEEEP
jgi:hypothetical protein